MNIVDEFAFASVIVLMKQEELIYSPESLAEGAYQLAYAMLDESIKRCSFKDLRKQNAKKPKKK